MNQANEAKILAPGIENESFPSAVNSDWQGSIERESREQLSHKRRTPLNAIIGFTELLARRPGAAAKDPDVQHILKAARDLLEIMNRELGDPNVPPKSAPNLVPPISCDVLYIEDDLVNFTLVERILEFRPALKLLHAVKGETGIELAQIHRSEEHTS